MKAFQKIKRFDLGCSYSTKKYGWRLSSVFFCYANRENCCIISADAHSSLFRRYTPYARGGENDNAFFILIVCRRRHFGVSQSPLSPPYQIKRTGVQPVLFSLLHILFFVDAELHAFVHIIVPFEILVEIHVITMHFFYQ